MFRQTVGTATLILAFCLPTLLHAGTTGNIVGTITDSTGAVVPDARVAVIKLESNARRVATSNKGGSYSVPLLVPGLYRIEVNAGALRGTLSQPVRIDVDQTARVDVVLEVTPVRQEVAVTGTVSLLQTDTSSIGVVIDESTARSLPLNERNFLSFALLVPGAQSAVDGSQNSSQGIVINSNGAREQSNNFLLDGVDNNDVTINHYNALPSMDAIQEFNVQSSTSSAEFGRGGGAQINVVLKSGTNALHGSAFDFFRNRRLDAKNFFDAPECTPTSPPGTCGDIPRLDRNQFGGVLGGPLRRDRMLFFVSYEGLRLRQATTREATVPSQVQRAAALAAVPVPQQNPAGLAVLNLLPLANVGTNLVTSNRFVSAPTLRQDRNHLLAKLDYLVASSDTVSAHYALSQNDQFNPFDPLFPFTNLPGFGRNIADRAQNLGAIWVHGMGVPTINEFRAGFTRASGTLLQEHAGTNKNQELGFPTVLNESVDLGFPEVAIAGFDGIGEPFNLPQSRTQNTFQISDALVLHPRFNAGRHHFKIGADVRRIQLNRFLDLLARGRWAFLGVFTGNSLEDLLRGLPAFALAVQGDSQLADRSTAVSLYLQDDLQATSHLTINLGLRWEYNSPPIDVHDRLSVPDLTADSVNCLPKPDCQFIVAGTLGVPRATYGSDRKDFGPRVGFAWRPFSTEHLVVRSGYGIFYDVAPLDVNLFPRLNPPFIKQLFFPNTGSSTIQTILSEPSDLTPPVVRTVARNFRTPYVQQWNLDLQYGVGQNLVMDLAYVGSSGSRLPAQRDLNQALPGTGVFPFSQFGPLDTFLSKASSNYHALQVRAERRLSKSLSFLSSYTWSRSIDDASSLFGTATEPGLPQDSLDARTERALSDFQAKHRLVFSYTYGLPFGRGHRWVSSPGPLERILSSWHVGAIVLLQSGRPFTINRGIDQSQSGTAGLGIFADRPDQVSDPFQPGPVMANPDLRCHLMISQGGFAADVVRTAQTWFNPCAFVDPGIDHFGTAGRNSVIGPGLQQIDLSFSKETRLGKEAQTLEVRADFFNVLNHPNFDTPDRNFDSATFGALKSANSYGTRPPRQIQIGLRYSF